MKGNSANILITRYMQLIEQHIVLRGGDCFRGFKRLNADDRFDTGFKFLDGQTEHVC